MSINTNVQLSASLVVHPDSWVDSGVAARFAVVASGVGTVVVTQSAAADGSNSKPLVTVTSTADGVVGDVPALDVANGFRYFHAVAGQGVTAVVLGGGERYEAPNQTTA
jgi:hypothetical protein